MATVTPASIDANHSDQQFKISHRDANRLFWIILISHCLIWILLPILTQPNVPLDSLEMIIWGQEWQLGYYKHPPLPAWMAEIASRLGGNTIWPTYLLSQLSTAACFFAVYRIGREALGNGIALLAVLLLEACYYYNFTTPEFNNNVTSRGFCALAVLFLHQGLVKEKTRYWILAGVAIGLGMLSKYDTAIFALAMVLFAVVHPRGRAAWRTAGPYALLTSAVVCFLPHLIWLIQNDFPTVHYFLRRSSHESAWWTRFVNPLKFSLSQMGAIGPILLLAIPLTGWRWRVARKENSEENFHRDFLLWFGLCPFLLVLLAGLVTGAQIRSMWGTALWTFTGLALLCTVQLRLTVESSRRVASLCLTAGFLFAVSLVARNLVFPHFREKGSRIHFPGQQLAEHVRSAYKTEFGYDPEIIAGPWWEAANVAMYGGERAKVYFNLDDSISKSMNDETFRDRGGVIVWQQTDKNKEYQRLVAERFPEAHIEPPISLKWNTSANLPPAEFQMVFVEPLEQSLSQVADAKSDDENSIN